MECLKYKKRRSNVNSAKKAIAANVYKLLTKDAVMEKWLVYCKESMDSGGVLTARW